MRVLWSEGEEEKVVDEELLSEEGGQVPSREVFKGYETQQVV